MVEVRFYDSIDDSLLKFAVIIAKTDNKWVFCKHRERDTYEVPGGHREDDESFGMLYYADIFSFEELHSEIETILITDKLVDNWTYPLIQAKLIEEAQKRGFI